MAECSIYERWAALADNEITTRLVQQLLSPVQDDLWVAAACVDRILDDVETQRALLELGLERTEGASSRIKNLVSETERERENSEAPPKALVDYFEGDVTNAYLCRIRKILLSRKDRLQTFEEVVKNTVPLRLSGAIIGETVGAEEESWEDDPWADDNPESNESNATPASPDSAVPPLPLSVFLSENIATLCLALASQAQFGALAVLMKRHPKAVYPFRFQALSRIPLFIDPEKYRNLLPVCDTQSGMEQTSQGIPWRTEEDIVETDDVQLAISQARVLPDEVLVEDFDFKRLAHAQPDPASSEQLLSWYKDRVESIVASTGMIDVALSLVQHGVSHGILSLDELGEDLTLIARLVYDANAGDGSEDQPILLREWPSLEPPDIIRKYLAHSTPDTVVNDLRRLVMPYLFVLESRSERAGNPDPDLTKRYLYDYILHADLETVVPIFEASKPTQVASQRIISDDDDLARLALACLYGNERLDKWTSMSRIFECLPAWNFANEEDDDDETGTTVASLRAFLAPTTSRPQTSPSDLLMFFKPLPSPSLSRALDILDLHLESGEILSRWGVPVPLRWFLQSAGDEAQQRTRATKMARQADAPSGDLDSEDIWQLLLEDMLKIARPGQDNTNSAFGALSQDAIKKIFFRGILSTGRFTIAKHLIQLRHGVRLLDPDAVESICLDCSREFYDNASSGNYNFGDMKLAYDCLSVAPQTYRIKKEREFIEATSRISSFNVMSRPGVPMLPIEVRLTKDKLSLISRILSSNESAYKHVEVLLDLIRKLGYQGDGLAEVKTLAMVADAALQAEDFNKAFESNERMINAVLRLRQNAPLGADNEQVREAIEVCWVACYQLGRQSEAQDVERKMALLGRALELCPPDRIVDILASWNKLESELMEHRHEQNAKRRLRTAERSRQAGRTKGRTETLSSKLQNSLHMPSPALPSASALASHTFSRVAASFPFAMHGRSGDERNRSRDRDRDRGGSPDVQSQARHALKKGVGWLIGADEDEL